MDWFSVRILLALQNAVKRAMRAPRLRSAVLMFNLPYVHRYGMARKDLLRQLGGNEEITLLYFDFYQYLSVSCYREIYLVTCRYTLI